MPHNLGYDGNSFSTISAPNAIYTQTTGINDSGTIVGHYSVTPGGGGQRG